MSGAFLSTDSLTGTVVEDAAVDPDVQQICGDEGLVLGFSAPVKDASGKPIGVWKNFADFALVEHAVASDSKLLEDAGLGEAEVTLINSDGDILVDCDPKTNGKPINRDMDKVVLKLNLVEKGVALAARAVQGGSDSMRSLHARKKEWQSGAYAHSAGALGFKGLGWSILVRVPERISLASMYAVHWRIAVVSAVVVVLVLGLSLFVSRSVLVPISKAMEKLEEISFGEGDLTKNIAQVSNDEVGQMAHCFNIFIDKLRDIIHTVKESSGEVASLSSRIAASAEQMSAAVGEVAQQTTQVASTAEDSGRLARSGKTSVDQTVSGMSDIELSVRESAQSVAELGARGEKIGAIVQTINDIADQTNLLALNAAIEAARAGEHGRGFAVVADEVRKLAERTTRATDEIGDSISAIQSETRLAVERMSRGQEQVQAGVQLVGVAGTNMAEIVHGAAQVAGMIHAISAAAEQAGAGARESAEAAAQLSAKAEALSEKMSRFQTERRSRPRGPGAAWKRSPTGEVLERTAA